MKIRPIDLTNLHPKLQVVLYVADGLEEGLHVTSTWRNDEDSVHYYGRGADVVLYRGTPEASAKAMRSLASKINEFFDYGRVPLVAVDETEAPANPEKAAIWGPHIHLQVRDETRLK